MYKDRSDILKWKKLVEGIEDSESLESEDLESKKGKGKVTKQKVLDWFKENPNPDDDKVHAWADEMGWDHHELEEMIYRIVTDCSKEEKEDED